MEALRRCLPVCGGLLVNWREQVGTYLPLVAFPLAVFVLPLSTPLLCFDFGLAVAPEQFLTFSGVGVELASIWSFFCPLVCAGIL